MATNEPTTPRWIATATLLVAGFGAVMTVPLWWATSSYTALTAKMVAAGRMPYVAIDMLNVGPSDEGPGIHIETQMKNFGSGPAYEVIIQSDTLRDGKSMRTGPAPVQTPTMYPPDSSKQRGIGDVVGLDHEQLRLGNWKLEVTLDARYKGADGKSYHYHAKEEFSRFTGGFRFLEEWCKDESGHYCGSHEED